DMHGNMHEWCRDWYDSGFYERASNVDPEDTRAVNRQARLTRGGAWNNYPYHCRSAARGTYIPALSLYTIGFRVVVEIASDVK
ncbi:MAG: SUMF1/EgtB/PvdO family nonheme iron enzyme, partial [bacterium]|nr:SUMF1/EgtB/PvdO family nonheme iron enzyme [bacterium]